MKAKNLKYKLSAAIRGMFKAQEALKSIYPKKPFTPDGRMMGDIGEAIAELFYQVKIDEKVRRDWDGIREDGIDKYFQVQVKATQRDESYLNKKPPHEGSLLVFKILRDGNWECHYNGSINRVWEFMSGKEKHTSEKFIKFDKLDKLNDRVGRKERIPFRTDSLKIIR